MTEQFDELPAWAQAEAPSWGSDDGTHASPEFHEPYNPTGSHETPTGYESHDTNAWHQAEQNWDSPAESYGETQYEDVANHGGHAPGTWGPAPTASDEPEWSSYDADDGNAINQPVIESDWDDRAWDDDDIPDEPQRKPEKKKKLSLGSTGTFVAFLSIAVVVILGAAALAFKVASQDPAGPVTPEEAAQGLIAAIENEDLLGAAELLLPSERESLINPSLELVAELKRVGIIDADTNLNQVQGLQIDTSNITMEVEEVDDEVRWVTINGGEATVSSQSVAGVSDLDDLPPETIAFADEPASFAVVKEDGYWYPSLWFTVAESIRRESGAPSPALPRKPIGSRSPEAAVALFVDSAVEMRPSAMLTSMDPEEMRAAYHYSSLFFTDLDSAALEMRRDLRSNGASWELSSLDTSVQTDGDKGVATIEGFVIVGVDDFGESYVWSYADKCFTMDADSGVERICEGEEGFPEFDFRIRVVKRGGDWFVSGFPSVANPIIDFLKTKEAGEYESFDELIDSLPSFDELGSVSTFELAPVNPSDEEERQWIDIYSVETTIPAGTKTSELGEYLVRDQMPRNLVPDNPVLNLASIADSETTQEIPAGSVLTSDTFVLSDPEPDPEEVPEEEEIPAQETTTTTSFPEEQINEKLFPIGATWERVDRAESVLWNISPSAREPKWVANRTDGSATIQVIKLQSAADGRNIPFNASSGWQRAVGLEFPAYASSEYAVVVVGNYLVVSLNPRDDSGILLDQARYLYDELR